MVGVRATVNGRESEVRLDGRYLQFPVLEKGAKIVVSFPVSERTVVYKVPGAPWTSKYSIVDENSGSGMALPKSIERTPADIVKQMLVQGAPDLAAGATDGRHIPDRRFVALRVVGRQIGVNRVI